MGLFLSRHAGPNPVVSGDSPRRESSPGHFEFPVSLSTDPPDSSPQAPAYLKHVYRSSLLTHQRVQGVPEPSGCRIRFQEDGSRKNDGGYGM